MSSQITCVWNVWRKGSDTFAEKLSFESKIEPLISAPLKLFIKQKLAIIYISL